jgi:hypothetical protein
MKIACIYWYTSSVGGIATHLNTWRNAAIEAGDTFHILHSKNWKSKVPALFTEREWVRGGDTRIWIDGEVPQTEAGARWLEKNYDVVLFGFICPHETKAYPTQDYLPLYNCKLPKAACVMDGYWDEYSDWAVQLLPKLKGVLCPLESYAIPLRKLGMKNLIISPFPFCPQRGKLEPKSKTPLLVWPCQWKNIKGITQFIDIVPKLPSALEVQMYSNGIRYYQLRSEDRWKRAIDKDHFDGFNGQGRAEFFGNVDLPIINGAYQRAWFTVNLQGMSSRKETYKRGSYNNTEVEALWYGALPILHESTNQTDLPKDVYVSVSSADEIPALTARLIKSKLSLDPDRQAKAREFVAHKHLASERYKDVQRVFQ